MPSAVSACEYRWWVTKSSLALTCLLLSGMLFRIRMLRARQWQFLRAALSIGRPPNDTDSRRASRRSGPAAGPGPAAGRGHPLAKRITHTSTTGINDSDHEVTAVVFAPKGTPRREAGRWLPSASGERHPAGVRTVVVAHWPANPVSSRNWSSRLRGRGSRLPGARTEHVVPSLPGLHHRGLQPDRFHERQSRGGTRYLTNGSPSDRAGRASGMGGQRIAWPTTGWG